MVDFKTLKAKSGKASLEDLNKKLEKLDAKESYDDPRFWQPTVDKAGNGYAVIRFLPPQGEEETPYVRMWEHGFQGPTGLWYIENSRTTLGKNFKDPVTDFNNVLWKKSDDDESPERKQVRRQKRKLHYFSNIQVIVDSGKPENEGKVFLYKYGSVIFTKITNAQKPPFDAKGRQPEHKDYDPSNAFNPFDFWTGANFALKIVRKDKQRNYDNSEFMTPGPLSDNDKELEKIWKQEYPLLPLIAEDKFKDYDKLKERFDLVLGLSNGEDPVAKVKKAEDADIPWARTDETPKEKARETKSIPEDDDDDSLEFFKNLGK